MKLEISETMRARTTKLIYILTTPPFVPVNELKPNSKRNLNARQFMFANHNNYQRANDFKKIDCDRIIIMNRS